MTAFNPHHLIRHIPAIRWQEYFSVRQLGVPPDFDWQADEHAFADALSHLFESCDPPQRRILYTEPRHVHALADRKGLTALLNASEAFQSLRETFAGLCNPAERVLWTLIHDPVTFATAESLVAFDRGVGRRRGWKRHSINVSEPVSREPADLEALQTALSNLLTPRQGPRRACRVELCDRYLDDAVQLSVYLEDDPGDLVEFMGEGDHMARRTTRPIALLALVYYPAAGLVDTVGQGGAKVHLPLVNLFARHLLHREVKPEAVKQPLFHLNRLREGLALPDDSGIDLSALGIVGIHFRQARLRSQKAPWIEYWAVVPANSPEPSVLAASHAHLKERDLFRGAFNIIEALISVLFLPGSGGKKRTVLNLDLKQSGLSNLSDLDEDDAHLAERLLKAWGITEPTDLELAFAA